MAPRGGLSSFGLLSEVISCFILKSKSPSFIPPGVLSGQCLSGPGPACLGLVTDQRPSSQSLLLLVLCYFTAES